MKVSFLFFALLSAGCAYRVPSVHAPESLPGMAPVRVDEVAVVDRTGEDASALATVKSDATAMLTKSITARGDRGCPAKVRVKVELVDREDNIFAESLHRDGFAIFGMMGVPFGEIIDHESVGVEITIETRGRTMTGRGSAALYGSIYAPARKRALALAVDRALAAADP